jgi:DNA-directed RNA polymerase subunit RPC12/RpoP
MLVFECQICRSQLQAEESQAGQLVRCPTCLTTLRVPAAAPAGALVGAGASTDAPGAGTHLPPRPNFGVGIPGGIKGGKRYGFNCAYCSSRLEASESMAGQHGQCPTCGNNIVIPILDRYGRLIDPMTGKVIKQDPHPVHAYAAAGERAPRIIRQAGGAQGIQCPRCSCVSPIASNNCKNCGMPFTMEGTTLEASGSSNGFCVASLVLGIIGVPGGCLVIPPLLAIVFGIIGLNQVGKSGSEAGGKGMAIAGIVCGLIGSVIAVLFYF